MSISFSDQVLLQAILVKRYKRFLADIELPSGELVTIHCPNTGSMKNCLYPGEAIWYSTSSNPKRKYSRTWELAETPSGHIIGINTGRANALVKSAIEMALIPGFEAYKTILREVPYGAENSRIDLLLRADEIEREQAPDCYVEVKSATLLEETSMRGSGFFPDSVSVRASKHLRELMYMVSQGHRAVLIYCVQHTGIQSVAAAEHIDSRYAEEMRAALAAGVEVMAARFHMSPEEIRFDTMIDYIVPKVDVKADGQD